MSRMLVDPTRYDKLELLAAEMQYLNELVLSESIRGEMRLFQHDRSAEKIVKLLDWLK